MKRNFGILLLLWILSLIGISFFGGPVSYGFFFLLTLIPIVSLIYIFLVILLFKIYQDLEGNSVVCREPAVFHFILQNESPLLFSGVRVIFYSSFSAISGLDDHTEYELHPHSGIRRKTTMICRYRGEYEVGIKAFEITDLFRLFTVIYRNREPFRITVKPRIVHLSQLANAEIVQNSVRDARVSPSEADVLQRDYVPGDDPRLISWKTYASLGKLMVRQRIAEQQEGVGILLDPRRYDERNAVYLPLENKMLEIVIALNLFFSEKGIPVETYYLDRQFETCRADRENGFEMFYERMSKYRFHTENSIEQLFAEAVRHARIFDKKTVFLVVHEWNEVSSSVAEELSRNNVSAVVYAVRDEAIQETAPIPRVTVIKISPEADLSEVLG